MTRYVVTLEIAGTAHVVLAARDADTAVASAYAVARSTDLGDWWPRRQTGDFIAPHAARVRSAERSFDVALPILGIAKVAVGGSSPGQAIEAAYRDVTAADIVGWRPVRIPAPWAPPKAERVRDAAP